MTLQKSMRLFRLMTKKQKRSVVCQHVSGDADRRLLSAAGAWLHVRTRDGCRSGLSPPTKAAMDCRTDEARGEYIRLGEPSSLGAWVRSHRDARSDNEQNALEMG